MWLLFVRHAHRDTSDPDADNELSEKGHKQGKALVQFLKEQKPLRKPKRVISSPKLRCRETAQYVADWAGVRVEISQELQDASLAGDRDLRARVKKFAAGLKQQNELCFVSHGDFLPYLGEVLGERGLASEGVRKGNIFWLVDGKVQGLNAISR